MAIPNDKLGFVVGTPRSGTSLAMQILEAIGLPISGYDIPVEARFDKLIEGAESQEQVDNLNDLKAQRVAKAQGLNERFLELPGVVMQGLESTSPEVFGEKVDIGGTIIKVVARGFVPRSRRIGRHGVNAELIHKVLVMVRDPRSVSKSQSGLNRGEFLELIGGWASAEWADVPIEYINELGSFLAYYHSLPQSLKDRFIFVDYDELVDDFDTNLDAIAAHFEVDLTPALRAAAGALINPNLRRSADLFDGWTDEMAPFVPAAVEVYNALKTQNESDLASAKVAQENAMDGVRRESLHYYDKNIGVNRSGHLVRAMEENPSLKDDMVEKAKKRILSGYDLRAAKDFQELSETYTIDIPSDLGDTQEQNFVMYDGVKMTYERAARFHERLVAQGKGKIKPIQERAKIAKGLGE